MKYLLTVKALLVLSLFAGCANSASIGGSLGKAETTDNKNLAVDPKTDCARYRIASSRHTQRKNYYERLNNKQLDEVVTRAFSSDEERNDWWINSDEGKERLKAEKLEDEAWGKNQKAAFKVIRYHLDYSETELQRMWEWRSANGAAWKRWFTLSEEQKDQEEYGLFRYGSGKKQAPRLPWGEVRDFCDLILDS